MHEVIDAPFRTLPFDGKRAWTICFYSYRGGVGRTTLAVSTAINVARHHYRPVFLLDFDLEAPGIDEFERLRPPSDTQKGLVEYVQAYMDSSCEFTGDLREFVYEVPLPELDPSDSNKPVEASHSPKLYVMRAGRRDAQHRKFLALHNWDHFYRCEEGGRFFENLRAGAMSEFGCEVMIVDSRTGLSDIGGICLGHLADGVVFVFRPNSAHSSGMADAARPVHERERAENRLIPRLYVASQVAHAFESELEPAMVKEAQRIVSECEADRFPPTDPRAVPDFRGFFWPELCYVSERGKLRGACSPDAYLVEFEVDESIDFKKVASPTQQEHSRIVFWIDRLICKLGEYERIAQPLRRALIEFSDSPDASSTVKDVLDHWLLFFQEWIGAECPGHDASFHHRFVVSEPKHDAAWHRNFVVSELMQGGGKIDHKTKGTILKAFELAGGQKP